VDGFCKTSISSRGVGLCREASTREMHPRVTEYVMGIYGCYELQRQARDVRRRLMHALLRFARRCVYNGGNSKQRCETAQRKIIINVAGYHALATTAVAAAIASLPWYARPNTGATSLAAEGDRTVMVTRQLHGTPNCRL